MMLATPVTKMKPALEHFLQEITNFDRHRIALELTAMFPTDCFVPASSSACSYVFRKGDILYRCKYNNV